ncbi:hypothetical protein BROUX41_002745 [Berkeleyomyces rouxiae]|uniref:uncharacterized protein n=1 Tax=Berkeleyomyces rouxiae TaxID=2035830 RepID=UPI003B811BA6
MFYSLRQLPYISSIWQFAFQQYKSLWNLIWKLAARPNAGFVDLEARAGTNSGYSNGTTKAYGGKKPITSKGPGHGTVNGNTTTATTTATGNGNGNTRATETIKSSQETDSLSKSEEAVAAEALNDGQLKYIAVPGEWEREAHPDWPDSKFEIPKEVPAGIVYYVTRGEHISHGPTSHVERLKTGNIIKYPRPNPYNAREEELNFRDMRTEAEVYSRIGDSPYVPKLVNWDSISCSLTLECLPKGDLASYMRKTPSIPKETRQRWTLQAAAALDCLHAVDIIHCDVCPRNFLLDDALNIVISDFAGSSIDGSEATMAAGPRYLPPGWNWMRRSQKSDDVFSLGSVIYFIMMGREVFSQLKDTEVQQCFQEGIFPDDVHSLVCGSVILACWEGRLRTANDVVVSLSALYSRAAEIEEEEEIAGQWSMY